jgi:ABC-type branched-subunit amino acid transport system ATPase component
MTVLVVKDVVKRFMAVDAVAGVSLAVEPGERRVVIGPNGAGKTTLFHCLAGMHTATSGTILYRGEDITRLPPDQRSRRGIARTFQITNLFSSLSVTENVLIALAAGEKLGLKRFFKPMHADETRMERAAALLSAWGLSGCEREVRHISYGEQRQLELALAFASEPGLLLLDEPMAGLSSVDSGRVLDMLKALPRTCSVLMIEHDMDVALEFADRVSVMHHGKVIAEGDSADIRANSQVAELYLGLE